MNLKAFLILLVFSLTASFAAFAQNGTEIVQLKCLGTGGQVLMNTLFMLQSYEGSLTARGQVISTKSSEPYLPIWDFSNEGKYQVHSNEIKSLLSDIRNYNALACTKKTISFTLENKPMIMNCAPGSVIELQPSIGGLIAESLKIGKSDPGAPDFTYVQYHRDEAPIANLQLGTYNACDNFAVPVP